MIFHGNLTKDETKVIQGLVEKHSLCASLKYECRLIALISPIVHIHEQSLGSEMELWATLLEGHLNQVPASSSVVSNPLESHNDTPARDQFKMRSSDNSLSIW